MTHTVLDFRDLDRAPPPEGALPYTGHEALAEQFRAALEAKEVAQTQSGEGRG
jgi:hypothetical protein